LICLRALARYARVYHAKWRCKAGLHAREVLLVVLPGQPCIAAAAALRVTISVSVTNVIGTQSAYITSISCACTQLQEAGVETRSQVLN
jgi:hypothetical protein